MDSKDEPFIKELMPVSYDDPGVAKIGPFLISPDKFFLGKDQSITLNVKFEPSSEGKFEETFLLGCDNLRTYRYTISAESNMIELLPTLLNGKELPKKQDILKEIHFRDVPFLNPHLKTFEIENLTKNKINYEWKVVDSNKEFRLDPKEGLFNEREKKTFEVVYFANRLLASYCYISLIIKDIPLESVRNPPPHIQDQIDKNKSLTESERKSMKTEFVYFNFTLFGETLPVTYSISPEVHNSPCIQPINIPSEAKFTIRNNAKCKSFFRLVNKWQSHEDLHTRVVGVLRANKRPEEPPSPVQEKKKRKLANKAQVNYGRKSQSPNRNKATSKEEVEVRLHEDAQYMYTEVERDASLGLYPIEKEEELDFFIEYYCTSPLSRVKVSYTVEFNNSVTKSVDIIADFIGTKIRVCTRDVNFGVVKTFSHAEQEFFIENYSEVDAEILVKFEKNKQLDLESRLGVISV